MPNHCENFVEITGNPKLINKLLKQVEITESEATSRHEKSKFSCHKVIPRPTDQDNNWYEWNIAHWGSKWGAYDLVENENDWEGGHYSFFFMSAWSPLTLVIEELARQYPKLNFFYRYHEGGCDFWGKHWYSKGKEQEALEGQLSSAECDILNEFYGEEHHWCQNCGDSYMCNSNDELCNTCLEEELKLQDELLDETENKGESNLISAGTND